MSLLSYFYKKKYKQQCVGTSPTLKKIWPSINRTSFIFILPAMPAKPKTGKKKEHRNKNIGRQMEGEGGGQEERPLHYSARITLWTLPKKKQSTKANPYPTQTQRHQKLQGRGKPHQSGTKPHTKGAQAHAHTEALATVQWEGMRGPRKGKTEVRWWARWKQNKRK